MKTEASYDDSSYEQFEPYCKWKRETTSNIEEVDVVEIHLRGFKKEELKNEFGHDKFLHISGEHPMGNRIKRFSKKIDVSKYDIEKIEAEFEDGNIHLRLPVKRCAISFRKIGRDNGTGVIQLCFGNGAFKCTIFVFLLLVLVVYMYKYFLCTSQNWFK